MIYLDSSAIVKLVHREAETESLADWLHQWQASPLISSALAAVEVPRALRRHAPAALPSVPAVLGHFYLLEMDVVVRETAEAFADPNLRTLDAIHLASAVILHLEDHALECFVAYDERLLSAVTQLGLPVASPRRLLA